MKPCTFGVLPSGKALPCAWLKVSCDLGGSAGDGRFGAPGAEVMVGFNAQNIAFTGSAQSLFDIADAIHGIRRNPGERDICRDCPIDHLHRQSWFCSPELVL